MVLEGREITALFDKGSIRNYTLREVAEGAPQIKVKPYTMSIGGKTMIVHEK